jgi:electron transfer flavoprotein alpha subunit
MSDVQKVLICGEVIDWKITTGTAELLDIGRKLADDCNQPLSILLMGQDITKAAQEAITLGADKVYTVDGVSFAELYPERSVAIIIQVCQQVTPSILLFTQTDTGRDLAPRLAARLKTTVCTDCVDVTVDPKTKTLLQTKPVYGGNAMAVWASQGYLPQVIVMRPRAAAPAEPDPTRKGEISALTINIDDALIRGKIVETVKEKIRGIKLEEAEVIVAGGGGIGGSEGFKLLEELADVLGGTIATSRVPTDEGWMPPNLEVGQTAHMVAPKVYIAVGISGALQHLAGCSGSKYIVAINKDPEAHIFKEADFGVVGDYKEIVPSFIEKCKALLA